MRAHRARRRGRRRCSCGSRARPPRRPRWSAPSRCSATARASPKRLAWPSFAEDEAAHAADLLAALAILKPARRASSSRTRSCARPSTRTSAPTSAPRRTRARPRSSPASGASEERIAAQIVEAEPVGDAERVELLRRVAADALARGAPAAAVAWLGRALAEPPPPGSQGRGAARARLGGAAARRAGGASTTSRRRSSSIREPELLATAVRLLAQRAHHVGGRGPGGRGDRVGDRGRRARGPGAGAAARGGARGPRPAGEPRDPRPAARRGWSATPTSPGATPGERLVLASLAFERARASESAREAAAHIERALAGGRLLGEQEVDVAGPFYLLVVGLLATDALDLADACLEQALADARARASIPAHGVRARASRLGLACGGAPSRRAEADARTALELLTAHDIQLGTRLRAGPADRGADRGRRGRGRRAGAARAAASATRSRRAWRATTCSRRAACCASRRAGRARGSTTWSSSAAATSSGEARTRSPRAGARTPALALAALGDARGARAGWPPTTSSGRGAGEPRAGSASRCAPPRWSSGGDAVRGSPARGRRTCSRARRRGSSTPARSPTWAPRCAAPTAAPRREARSRTGSISPSAAAPVRSRSGADTELRAAGGRSSDPRAPASSS